MRWPPQRELEGAIVRLEQLAPEHRDDLLGISREPEIWTWMNREIPADDEAFGAWFDARLTASQAGEEWCFVTRSVERGDLIGSSSYLSVRPEHDRLEIGWSWLHPAAWRTGANVEAKLLMLTEAFDGLGCMRVEFETDTRNERSRAALSALPATFEGILRQHLLMPGIGRRDSAFFSIIDTEWPDVRANLERRLAAGRREAATA
jgi:RimJ/RimL family protein N-acetyltransferase